MGFFPLNIAAKTKAADLFPLFGLIPILVHGASWMWIRSKVKKAGGWIPAGGNRNPNVIPRLVKEYLKIANRNGWPSWPAHLCWLSLAAIPLWFVGYYLLRKQP
jgi:hypothetical protein